MPGRIKTLRLSILATLMVWVFICGHTLLLLFPTDREARFESVLLRNSLIAKVGDMQDFVWSPSHPPKGYISEPLAAPDFFKSVAEGILREVGQDATNFDKAILIARHLGPLGANGSAIRSNTRDTYERIVHNGEGFCSDFSQVLNALSIASGIPVREWHMSPEDGKFHSFNEIYDPTLSKWVLVDSHLSFFVRESSSGTPLSVMEFQEYLREGSTEEFAVVPIVDERFGFFLESSEAEVIDYYRHGTDMLYLLGGNNVFSFDANPLVRKMGSISRSLEMATAILIGVHPKFWIVPNESNQVRIRDLFAKRRNFFVMIGAGFVLAIALVLQIFVYTRIARGERSPFLLPRPRRALASKKNQ